MRAKYINFTEDSDPIRDMEIGMDAEIKRWVENETKFSYEDFKKDLLWICARSGKIDFVKYLLNKGYDVHYMDDAALRYACANGHTRVVKFLIDVGADVHAQGDYALREASYYGHPEVIKLLLDAGADVHARDNESLRVASKYNHPDVVKLLLDAGADVHVRNDYALRWATKKGHTEMVKLLQDHIAKEKQIVKESVTHFVEDSDPIQDMGIGIMQKIKATMQDVIDFYKIKSNIEEYRRDNKFGYSVEIELPNYEVNIYYVIFNESKKTWIAEYREIYGADSESETYETYEEAINRFEYWIESEMYYRHHN